MTAFFTPTDDQLRAMWRAHGGRFHGPNIETGAMPESELLPFLRGLATIERAPEYVERSGNISSADCLIAIECAASGRDCHYKPTGPNKEQQCQYCGEPPPSLKPKAMPSIEELAAFLATRPRLAAAIGGNNPAAASYAQLTLARDIVIWMIGR